MKSDEFLRLAKDPSLLIALAVIAIANTIDAYLAYVATSWVIFGLLGMSLVLVWGYGGLLSLGQTAFYGLGGYIGSIVAINFAPLTGNTLIWSLPAGIMGGMLSASAIGGLIFYSRMGALQSTIVTYTFTLILWTGTVSLTMKVGNAVVGGDNGMSNIPGFVITFGENASGLSPNMMFLTVLILATLTYIVAKFVIESPFGRIIKCIRIDAEKTELMGYDVRRFNLLLFVFAGGIAGLAGSLFGAWAKYLNPSVFSVQEALLVPIYVLVGGLGYLAGPFLGAVTVGSLSFWLGGGVIGGQTTLVIGVILILLVLFFPAGIIGGIEAFIKLFKRKLKSGQPQTGSVVQLDEFDFSEIARVFPEQASPTETMLKTEKVTKSFGGVTAVSQVDQSFTSGQIWCLIGPNGAGKSSFLKTCTGAYKPDSGQIYLNDINITKLDPFARVNLGMGVKNQKAQVFHELTVVENLWVAAYSKCRNEQRAELLANRMVAMLGMNPLKNFLASELSHGQQQWLDIGMVLCLSPKVILLDEPAAGMTLKERRKLSDLVKQLGNEAAVVVVDHDMDFIRSLDTKVTVLHQGKIFARGTMKELRQDERILDIYLGRRRKYV